MPKQTKCANIFYYTGKLRPFSQLAIGPLSHCLSMRVENLGSKIIFTHQSNFINYIVAILETVLKINAV